MRGRWRIAAGLAGAAATLAAAAQAAPPISVTNGQVRASLKGTPNSAAYMVIANSGRQSDSLVSARCACAGMVAIHKSEDQGGMSMMASAAPVAIPPHGQVAFRPGGLHLMLMDVKGQLKAGGVQDITLVFQRAGAVTAHFAIRAAIR